MEVAERLLLRHDVDMVVLLAYATSARTSSWLMPPPGGEISGFELYSSVCSKYGEYTLILYAANVRSSFFWNSSVGTGPRERSSWKPR